MRVAIVNNQAPFVRGGAELLAEALRDELVQRGHEASVIRIPFKWSPPIRIAEHMLAARLLRFPNADRVVALKFPAYYVQHDDKVIWLLHQFRQAYDLYTSEYGGLGDTREGPGIREMIQRWDELHLGSARAVFSNSEITRDRLARFNGIDATVVYPPLWDVAQYRCDDYGDYIFAPGRLSPAKRQDILIEAMEHVSTDVRLIVAGPPETPDFRHRLEQLAAGRKVQGRVTLIPRWLSDNEKYDLLGGALASAYIPYDEDSYGYVTLESFQCRKPVVTCTDAGGVLSLVADGRTGYVTEPEPRAIAAAFDALRSGNVPADRLGENGFARTKELQISWDHVVASLLA